MRTLEWLVIGCGNLLRGDDAVGPSVVRRLVEGGLPPGGEAIDAGTSGIDAVLRMRGVPEVIVVDACRSGGVPGELFEFSGSQLDRLAEPAGPNLHAFRWDQALAASRFLLGGEGPKKVRVLLVEGASFEPGAGLSAAVDRGVEAARRRILELLGSPADPTSPD